MDPFEDCLAKGRLKEVETDPEKIAAELDTAREELARARSAYGDGNWGAAVTQGYFALYRAAKAALLAKGYRETNLYGLTVGLKRLFVEPGKIPEQVIHQIRDAKDAKDLIYDGGRSNRGEARQIVSWAQHLLKRVFELLMLPGFEPDSIDTTLPEPKERPRMRGPRRRRPPYHGGHGGYGAGYGGGGPYGRDR